MIDQVLEIRKAEQLVLDTGDGSLTAAQLCLLLKEHRRFVGFEKYSALFQETLRSPDGNKKKVCFETTVGHIWNPDRA